MSYVVELLFETDKPPIPQKQKLLESLRRHAGPIASLDKDDNSKLLAFVYLDHVITYEDGKRMPAQCVIMATAKPLDRMQPALQQAWDWPEAAQTVSRCRSTLTIMDLMADGLPYQTRLDMFHKVVQAVLELAPCKAIYWTSSERLVSPALYQQNHANGDLIYPAVNVRLFRIQDRAPGESVMDTLGLSAFGLPDVQCHFTQLDPSRMAQLLFNLSHYLYHQGDVIEDGHTIDGLTPNQKWKCQHETALVPPEREVVDINPGPPYAAGNRN